MIVLIIALFALMLFLTSSYVDSRAWRYLWVAISLIGLAASVALMVANDHSHYGMKRATETKQTKIYSAMGSDQAVGALIYAPVGTKGEHAAYVYRKTTTAKKVTKDLPSQKTRSVIKHVKTGDYQAYAIKETNTYRWVYKNDMFKHLFNYPGASGDKTIKKEVTYRLPQSWFQARPDEMKKLQGTLMKVKAAAKSKQGDDKTMSMLQLMGEIKSEPDKAKAAQMELEAFTQILHP